MAKLVYLLLYRDLQKHFTCMNTFNFVIGFLVHFIINTLQHPLEMFQLFNKALSVLKLVDELASIVIPKQFLTFLWLEHQW